MRLTVLIAAAFAVAGCSLLEPGRDDTTGDATPAGAPAVVGTPAAPPPIRVAGGAPGAAYAAVGPALCAALARETGRACEVQDSRGAVENLRALRLGQVDLAFAQSDTLATATLGTGPFRAAGADPDLRAVARLFAEPLALFVRHADGVRWAGALRGRPVAAGEPGSGTRALMVLLARSGDWKREDARFVAVAPGDLAAALCDRRVEAAALVAAHPVPVLTELAARCRVRLLPIAGRTAAALVAGHPFLEKATIPARTYQGSPRDVPTIAVAAALVARAETPDALVEAAVAALVTMSGEATPVPALAGATPERLSAATAAPLHPAAKAAWERRTAK